MVILWRTQPPSEAIANTAEPQNLRCPFRLVNNLEKEGETTLPTITGTAISWGIRVNAHAVHTSPIHMKASAVSAGAGPYFSGAIVKLARPWLALRMAAE